MDTKKAASCTTSRPLVAPAKTQFVTTEENSLAAATIQEILDADLPGGKEVVKFLLSQPY